MRTKRVNMTLDGELAQLVQQWQDRGLVGSAADAVRQGLLALHRRFQSMDERARRLQTLSNDRKD